MTKITIIGAGSVGSTIAYTLAVQGLASEIVMIDINGEKALGEALDIRQGTPFCSPVTIYAGTYRDACDSDIVILTSGVARKPGQTRLDLAQTNVDIVKTIIPQITTFAPDATYIIVSNPVDILTYVFCRYSELPENKIIGTGTILDTSRLRARISEYYSINQQNVHAYVFGEHGDTSFVPWSVANISNVPVDDYHNAVNSKDNLYAPIDHAEMETYIKKSGGRVIQRKGATYYAIALSTCHICKCLVAGMDTTLTLSSMMHGEYGLDDICLSTLNIVGRDGLRGKLIVPLNAEEQALLHKSAENLRAVIEGLTI
ncbi:MAG: L-lactate dehydrogenase [Clostridia bacterium]|nr:L-lactate dehydrogenase [Clostridia bacterium]MBQ4351248.1 L-lactate dehydrogenase [Clostridia bacterium]